MPTATFRVPEKQARAIRRAARLKHQTISEYMRASVIPAAPARPPKMILKKHPVSGLSYNAAPGQLTPSLSEIKAMLADFP